MKKLLLVAMLAVIVIWSGGFDVADAQATCEGVTGTGRCNSANNLKFTMPIANTDGTPFNDYSNAEAVFGPNAGVCATLTGQVVKNLGPLNVPVTPLPNTVVTASLGPIGFPNGKNFVAVRIVDLTGNRSGCSPEVSFTYDNVPAAAPTNTTVGQ